MHLGYTDHAMRRMRERNIAPHLAEVAIACGRRRYVECGRYAHEWGGFRFIVEDGLVITAYDMREGTP